MIQSVTFIAKRVLLIPLILLIPFTYIYSASGFFTSADRSFIVYDIGDGNVFSMSSSSPINLGELSTLILNGGEAKTFKNGPDDITQVRLHYRIWETASGPSGSFIVVPIFFLEDCGGGGTFSAGDPCNAGDQKWQTTGHNVNILTGLSSSTDYTLEFFFAADFNTGPLSGGNDEEGGGGQTHFDNNGGSNYQLTFTTIAPPDQFEILFCGQPQPFDPLQGGGGSEEGLNPIAGVYQQMGGATGGPSGGNFPPGAGCPCYENLDNNMVIYQSDMANNFGWIPVITDDGTCNGTIQTDMYPIGSGNADCNIFLSESFCAFVDLTNGIVINPNITDPCSCTDPLNIDDGMGNITLFHDYIEITMTGTGETWRLTDLPSGAGSLLWDHDSDPMTAPVDMTAGPTGTIIPETGTPGTYYLDVWHPDVTGFFGEFNRDVSPLVIPLSVGNACDNSTCANPVPALSEWGLFLLFLILINLGLVALINEQRKLAVAGHVTTRSPFHLPFDQKEYFKALKTTLLIVPFGFVFIYLGWGEIIVDDFIGMAMVIPFVGYLIYLLRLNK